MDRTGKSTLLNNLFGTNFREMDAFKGRHVLALVSHWMIFYSTFFLNVGSSLELRKPDRFHFFSGLKPLREFGWLDVLVLNLVLL